MSRSIVALFLFLHVTHCHKQNNGTDFLQQWLKNITKFVKMPNTTFPNIYPEETSIWRPTETQPSVKPWWQKTPKPWWQYSPASRIWQNHYKTPEKPSPYETTENRWFKMLKTRSTTQRLTRYNGLNIETGTLNHNNSLWNLIVTAASLSKNESLGRSFKVIAKMLGESFMENVKSVYVFFTNNSKENNATTVTSGTVNTSSEAGGGTDVEEEDYYDREPADYDTPIEYEAPNY